MRRISPGTIRLLSISSALLASIIPPGRAWFQPILGASSPAGAGDNQNRMKLQVECYSGRKADERPVRFQLSERGYLVEEVLDQWYGQDATSSKCARMMAICSYFGTTYPTRSGVWKRF